MNRSRRAGSLQSVKSSSNWSTTTSSSASPSTSRRRRRRAEQRAPVDALRPRPLDRGDEAGAQHRRLAAARRARRARASRPGARRSRTGRPRRPRARRRTRGPRPRTPAARDTGTRSPGGGASTPGPRDGGTCSGAPDALAGGAGRGRPSVVAGGQVVARRGSAVTADRKHLAAVGLAAQRAPRGSRSGRSSRRRAARLRRVEAEARPRCPSRPATLGGERAGQRPAPPRRRRGRRVEHRDGRVALAHRLEEAAAVRLHGRRRSARRGATSASRHRCRVGVPHRRRALDVGEAERHHAGRAARRPSPARRRSTNSPGVAGRRAGSVASPRRIARLELLGLRRVDALPGRQHAGGRSAGQQREGRRGEASRCRWPASGARRRRRAPGPRKPGVPRPAPRRVAARTTGRSRPA